MLFDKLRRGRREQHRRIAMPYSFVLLHHEHRTERLAVARGKQYQTITRMALDPVGNVVLQPARPHGRIGPGILRLLQTGK